MALMTLHREDFPGLNREKFRARLAELQAQYPSPATVTFRRWPRYGAGYTFYVKGEGTPAKIQHRAHCQFCGRHQVVKDGVLVLHGYERPGHGWIFGRCPGAGEKPLQREQSLTENYLAGARLQLKGLKKAEPKLARAVADTKARYEAEEPGLLYAKPHKPYSHNPTEAQKEQIERAYAEKLAAWYERHPASQAYEQATDALRVLSQHILQTQDQIEHFETLLGWKLLGTPYLEVAK